MTDAKFEHITPHVYWMSPTDPDRPSLCAVVGADKTIMLDAGASIANTQLFLDKLAATGANPPSYVALTHWHWDHIFGLPALNMPIIAHQDTVTETRLLKTYKWSNTALDERVAAGVEITSCANDIKLELPEPRHIEIIIPDIVMTDKLTINLGGVTCHIQHVGGDHAHDSCVMYIPEDKVLFLGDCLYDAIYTPTRYLTAEKALPLLDIVLSFDAEYYSQGHDPEVRSRAEIELLAEQMRYASQLVDKYQGDEVQALAIATQEERLDEDTEEFIMLFSVGYKLNITN